MTVRAYMELMEPTKIDLHNKIDPRHGVRYLGNAWCDLATGRWLCLADVGALCVVEVRLVVSGEGEAAPTGTPGGTPLLVVVGDEIPALTTSDPEETLSP